MIVPAAPTASPFPPLANATLVLYSFALIVAELHCCVDEAVGLREEKLLCLRHSEVLGGVGRRRSNKRGGQKDECRDGSHVGCQKLIPILRRISCEVFSISC